ncbi:MAG TPA: hypothetical protein VEU47_20530 [Candidatus Cybelea sp.]|nr:hypothetical protein [Candidatus Cybelea sp.]
MNGAGGAVARPELMAIGDSCYNGVRSLTITAPLAAWSVPAQVARAFGWAFKSPDYPRPILFDFEQIVRDPGQFATLRDIVIANARAWLAGGPWSKAEAFDNLSLAQARIADLATFTYADHAARLPALLGDLTGSSSLKLQSLVELHCALNGCFVLNPRNDPALPQAREAPIDIVAARRPKRLLVNIGINDGIWTVCLEATGKNLDADKIFADMSHLGVRLLELRTSGAVDRIYLNLLPKPSAVANLMPPRNPQKCPDAGGYYPGYLGRLGTQGGLSGRELFEIDTAIARLNGEIRDGLASLFAEAGGLEIVDTFAAMANQDDKHCRDPEPIRVMHGKSEWHLTNIPLQGFALFGGFTGGGLFGLDNLHPTLVGYAVLARSVCNAISAAEGIPPARPIDFQQAFDADSLLQDVPGLLDLEDFLLNLAIAFVS